MTIYIYIYIYLKLIGPPQKVIYFYVVWKKKMICSSFHVGLYSEVVSVEGSYLSSNRNSAKSERIENTPLAILISTKQF